MTCEIAIMNRQAIALAADSATTVTQWGNGKQEQRFFKGTNKIFQLSNHHPVGIMIFGSATLHEVPWELIIKDFRLRLGDKAFNDLSGYANELFDFVKTHSILFPQDYQVKVFRQEAEKAAFIFLILAGRIDSVKKAADDVEKKKKAYYEFFADSISKLDQSLPSDQFNQEDIDKALAAYMSELKSDVQRILDNTELKGVVEAEQLAQLVIKELLKHY